MQRSTIVIIAGTLAFFGAVGFYGYWSDAQAAAPFDAQEHYRDALVTAANQAPGQTLAVVHAERIDPEGKIHTDIGGSLKMLWRPIAPAAVAAPAPVVLGAPAPAAPADCIGLQVYVYKHVGIKGGRRIDDEVKVKPVPCGRSLGPGPRCTFVEVWQRAIAKGAPQPAYADIALISSGEPPVRAWHFTITDRAGGDKLVSDLTLPDDC